MMKIGSIAKLATLTLAVACVASLARAETINAKKPLRVFILAAQSNMEGHGNVELTESAVEQMKKNNRDPLAMEQMTANPLNWPVNTRRPPTVAFTTGSTAPKRTFP